MKLTTLILLLSHLTIFGQGKIDSVCTWFHYSLKSDTQLVEFQASNFKDIVSIQFDMRWDTSKIKWLGDAHFTKELPSFIPNIIGANNADNGHVRLAYYDVNIAGGSTTDCSTIFNFKMISKTGKIEEIFIPGSDSLYFENTSGSIPVAHNTCKKTTTTYTTRKFHFQVIENPVSSPKMIRFTNEEMIQGVKYLNQFGQEVDMTHIRASGLYYAVITSKSGEKQVVKVVVK